MKINPQNVVSLTYDLYVEQDGAEVLQDKATEEQPLTFLYGVGQMIPGFESSLAGLSTGDSFDFRIGPADAYGEYDDESVANLPNEMFTEGLPEIGDVLDLQNSEGHQFRGQVVSLAEDAVIVDLNHPMAGQELHFKGQILNVREATPEELAHGHVHGPGGHHH
ncbi:MAG TPA: peptidylprolyl isomerase [Mucilaginibacter sp.]